MNTRVSTQRERWGITALRVVVGIVFLLHGAQKVFVYGFSGVTGFLGRMGVPAPLLAAIVVSLVELLGGLALLLGLFTRWAAIALGIDMLVAILAVHLPAGFFMPDGYEFALTLLAGTIALALAGPGAAALDSLLAKRTP